MDLTPWTWHRVVELWTRNYCTASSYRYKRIKVNCQFICLIWGPKLQFTIIFGFSFDFDAFTSIQWVTWHGILSDSLHFAIENAILWQNKAFVMAWQHFTHFTLPKPPWKCIQLKFYLITIKKIWFDVTGPGWLSILSDILGNCISVVDML